MTGKVDTISFICNHSGMTGTKLAELKARLEKMSEEELNRELSRCISGASDPDSWTGLEVEHNESVVFLDNHDKTEWTDPFGNTISEYRDGNTLLKRTITTTDESGKKYQATISYSNNKPISSEVRKNGNLIESSSFSYNKDNSVTITTEKSDHSKTVTRVKSTDSNGYFKNKDFIDSTTTYMDGSKSVININPESGLLQEAITKTQEGQPYTLTTIYRTADFHTFANFKNIPQLKAAQIEQQGENEPSFVKYEYKEQLSGEIEPHTITHAKHGDSPQRLAAVFFNNNLEEFYKLNPDIKKNGLKVGNEVKIPGMIDVTDARIQSQGTIGGEKTKYLIFENEREIEKYRQENFPHIPKTVFETLRKYYGFELNADNISMYSKLNEIADIEKHKLNSPKNNNTSSDGTSLPSGKYSLTDAYNINVEHYLDNIMKYMQKLRGQGITDTEEIKRAFLSKSDAPTLAGTKINLFDGFTVTLTSFNHDVTKEMSIQDFMSINLGLDLNKPENKRLYLQLCTLNDAHKIQDVNTMISAIALRASGNYKKDYDAQVRAFNSKSDTYKKSVKGRGEAQSFKDNKPISAAEAKEMFKAVIEELSAPKNKPVKTKYHNWIEDHKDFYLREFATSMFYMLHTDNATILKQNAAQKSILSIGKPILNFVGNFSDYKGKEIYEIMKKDCYLGNKKLSSTLECYTYVDDAGTKFDKTKMQKCINVLCNKKSTPAQIQQALMNTFGAASVRYGADLVQTANFMDGAVDMALMLWGTGIISKGITKGLSLIKGAQTVGTAARTITGTVSTAQRLGQLAEGIGTSATTFAVWDSFKYTVDYYTNDIEEDFSYTEGLTSTAWNAAKFGAFAGAWGQIVTQGALKLFFKTPQAAQVASEAMTRTSKQLSKMNNFGSSQVVAAYNSAQTKAMSSLGREVFSFGSEVVGFSTYDLYNKFQAGEIKSSDDILAVFGEQTKTLLSFKAIGQILFMHRAGKGPEIPISKQSELKFEKTTIDGKEKWIATYPDGKTRTVDDMQGVINLSNRHYEDVTLYEPLKKLLEENGSLELGEGIKISKDGDNFSIQLPDGQKVSDKNLRLAMNTAQSKYNTYTITQKLKTEGKYELPDKSVIEYDNRTKEFWTEANNGEKVYAGSVEELLTKTYNLNIQHSIDEQISSNGAAFFDNTKITKDKQDGYTAEIVFENGQKIELQSKSTAELLQQVYFYKNVWNQLNSQHTHQERQSPSTHASTQRPSLSEIDKFARAEELNQANLSPKRFDDVRNEAAQKQVGEYLDVLLSILPKDLPEAEVGDVQKYDDYILPDGTIISRNHAGDTGEIIFDEATQKYTVKDVDNAVLFWIKAPDGTEHVLPALTPENLSKAKKIISYMSRLTPVERSEIDKAQRAILSGQTTEDKTQTNTNPEGLLKGEDFTQTQSPAPIKTPSKDQYRYISNMVEGKIDPAIVHRFMDLGMPYNYVSDICEDIKKGEITPEAAQKIFSQTTLLRNGGKQLDPDRYNKEYYNGEDAWEKYEQNFAKFVFINSDGTNKVLYFDKTTGENVITRTKTPLENGRYQVETHDTRSDVTIIQEYQTKTNSYAFDKLLFEQTDYHDEQGNLIKTQELILNDTDQYEITDIYPNGTRDRVGLVEYKSDGGIYSERTLTSLTGEKTQHIVITDAQGNYILNEQIIDPNTIDPATGKPKILAQTKRQFKVIDENTTETTINGVKYRAEFGKNKITLTKTLENGAKTTEVIEIADNVGSKDNKAGKTYADRTIVDILRNVPPDQLMYIRESGVPRIFPDGTRDLLNTAAFGTKDGGCLHIGRNISTASGMTDSPFIISHEIGHAIDAAKNISSNPELVEIYEQEKAQLLEQFPDAKLVTLDYLLRGWAPEFPRQEGFADNHAYSSVITPGGIHHNINLRITNFAQFFPRTRAKYIELERTGQENPSSRTGLRGLFKAEELGNLNVREKVKTLLANPKRDALDPERTEIFAQEIENLVSKHPDIEPELIINLINNPCMRMQIIDGVVRYNGIEKVLDLVSKFPKYRDQLLEEFSKDNYNFYERSEYDIKEGYDVENNIFTILSNPKFEEIADIAGFEHALNGLSEGISDIGYEKYDALNQALHGAEKPEVAKIKEEFKTKRGIELHIDNNLSAEQVQQYIDIINEVYQTYESTGRRLPKDFYLTSLVPKDSGGVFHLNVNPDAVCVKPNSDLEFFRHAAFHETVHLSDLNGVIPILRWKPLGTKIKIQDGVAVRETVTVKNPQTGELTQEKRFATELIPEEAAQLTEFAKKYISDYSSENTHEFTAELGAMILEGKIIPYDVEINGETETRVRVKEPFKNSDGKEIKITEQDIKNIETLVKYYFSIGGQNFTPKAIEEVQPQSAVKPSTEVKTDNTLPQLSDYKVELKSYHFETLEEARKAFSNKFEKAFHHKLDEKFVEDVCKSIEKTISQLQVIDLLSSPAFKEKYLTKNGPDFKNLIYQIKPENLNLAAQFMKYIESKTFPERFNAVLLNVCQQINTPEKLNQYIRILDTIDLNLLVPEDDKFPSMTLTGLFGNMSNKEADAIIDIHKFIQSNEKYKSLFMNENHYRNSILEVTPENIDTIKAVIDYCSKENKRQEDFSHIFSNIILFNCDTSIVELMEYCKGYNLGTDAYMNVTTKSIEYQKQLFDFLKDKNGVSPENISNMLAFGLNERSVELAKTFYNELSSRNLSFDNMHIFITLTENGSLSYDKVIENIELFASMPEKTAWNLKDNNIEFVKAVSQDPDLSLDDKTIQDIMLFAPEKVAVYTQRVKEGKNINPEVVERPYREAKLARIFAKYMDPEDIENLKSTVPPEQLNQAIIDLAGEKFDIEGIDDKIETSDYNFIYDMRTKHITTNFADIDKKSLTAATAQGYMDEFAERNNYIYRIKKIITGKFPKEGLDPDGSLTKYICEEICPDLPTKELEDLSMGIRSLTPKEIANINWTRLTRKNLYNRIKEIYPYWNASLFVSFLKYPESELESKFERLKEIYNTNEIWENVGLGLITYVMNLSENDYKRIIHQSKTEGQTIDIDTYRADVASRMSVPVEYDPELLNEHMNLIGAQNKFRGLIGKSRDHKPNKSNPYEGLSKSTETINPLPTARSLYNQLRSTGEVTLSIPNRGGVKVSDYRATIRENEDYLNIENDVGYNIRYAIQSNWSPFKIARDTMQNFYDGNGHTLEGVTVNVVKQENGKYKVKISGLSEYDYLHLYETGSTTKHSPYDAGGYGEGTRMVAASLLRSIATTDVKYSSGDWTVTFKRSSDDVKTAYMIQTLTRNEKRVDGSSVEFETLDTGLVEFILDSQNYFNHPDNPDTHNMDFENEYFGIKINQDEHGNPLPGNFYIIQRFEYDGKVEGGVDGLTLFFKVKPTHQDLVELNHDTEEFKLGTGADRGQIDQSTAIRMLSRYVKTMSDEDLTRAIVSMKRLWVISKETEKSNTRNFINPFIAEAYDRKLGIDFGNEPYAYVTDNDSPISRAQAQNMGYTLCVEGMRLLGMHGIIREENNPEPHTPNEYQSKKIVLIDEAVKILQQYTDLTSLNLLTEDEVNAPTYMFENGSCPGAGAEALIDNDKYLAHYMRDDHMQNQDFAGNLATWLHEISHKTGGDNSSSFSYQIIRIQKHINDVLLHHPEAMAQFRVLANMFSQVQHEEADANNEGIFTDSKVSETVPEYDIDSYRAGVERAIETALNTPYEPYVEELSEEYVFPSPSSGKKPRVKPYKEASKLSSSFAGTIKAYTKRFIDQLLGRTPQTDSDGQPQFNNPQTETPSFNPLRIFGFKKVKTLPSGKQALARLEEKGNVALSIPDAGGLNPKKTEITPAENNPKLGKTVKAGVTVAYTVRRDWSAEKIARDIMQNFYDGNGHTLEGVNVKAVKNNDGTYTVRIEGQGVYNYIHLNRFGGSDKDDPRDAGGFGEGSRVVAGNLINQGASYVRYSSGDWTVDFTASSDDMSTASMMRTLNKNSSYLDSNYMEFRTKDASIVEKIIDAANYFYSPNNPDFQNLVENEFFGFKVHPGKKGNLYFTQRFQTPDGAWSEVLNDITIVFKQQAFGDDFTRASGGYFAKFEKTRDRIALNAAEMAQMAGIFARTLTDKQLSQALKELIPIMSSSDPETQLFTMRMSYDESLQNKNLQYIFAMALLDNAQDRRGFKFDLSDSGMKLAVIDEHSSADRALTPAQADYFKKEGYLFVGEIFKDFGVESAVDIYNREFRPTSVEPTPAETTKLEILNQALHIFHDYSSNLFPEGFTGKKLYVFDENSNIDEREVQMGCSVAKRNNKYDGLLIKRAKLADTEDFNDMLMDVIGAILTTENTIKSSIYSYNQTDLIRNQVRMYLNNPQVAQELKMLEEMWNNVK